MDIGPDSSAVRGTAKRGWEPTEAVVGGAVVAVLGTCWYLASTYESDATVVSGALAFVLVLVVAPLLARWPLSTSRAWWTAAAWAAIGLPSSYFFGVSVLMGSAVCVAGLLTRRAIR